MAIDTSGKAVSAAVAEDGELVSQFWLRHGKTHAEALMPCVDAALSGLGITMADIDVFAVISGPGSFTGLRIGISTVKAFAYAAKKPAVGIPTLDALAKNLEGCDGALLCPIVEAKKGYVYQAIYRCGGIPGADGGNPGADGGNPGAEGGKRPAAGGMVRIADTLLVSDCEAVERLKSAFENNRDINRTLFNGDAALASIEYFRDSLGGFSYGVANEMSLYQNAASAALLACEAAAEGRLENPETLTPQYYNAGYIKTEK